MNYSNSSYRFLLRTITISFMLTSAFFSTATAEPEQTSITKSEYLMGVFPYLAPRELEKMYSPIAAEFSNTLKKDVLFRTSSTYKNFMKNLDKQMYDIVFVQPFDYVSIADKYGYRPLATRNKPLPAIIVIKPDSAIKSIKDLRGKTISLPPSVAAMSYLVKDHLEKNGIDPDKDVTIEHHRSHASCMRSVLIGNAQACGTAPPALRFFQDKMKSRLKIIAKTKGIPSTLFAIHPRITENQRKELLKQITGWPDTEKGKKLLKNTKVQAFIPIKDKKYNGVRVMSKKFR